MLISLILHFPIIPEEYGLGIKNIYGSNVTRFGSLTVKASRRGRWGITGPLGGVGLP